MRKIALIIPAVIAAGAGAYYFKIIGSEIALFEKYPDVPQKDIIEVHRELIKEVLAGKHGDAPLTDEYCEKVFEQKLAARKLFPNLF